MLAYPALKRRAKFITTLRVESDARLVATTVFVAVLITTTESLV